jgi:hypothetical protein
VGKEAAVLLHVSQLSPKQNRRLAVNIFPTNRYFAALGLDQTIEATEKGGFPRTAFSNQSYCLSRRNVDADVVERYHTPESVRDISRC